MDPVVVITGRLGDELEKHISKLRVICLRNEQYENTQMYDSICQEMCIRDRTTMTWGSATGTTRRIR